MTQLLEKAFAEAAKLPEDQQDSVAALLLKEIGTTANESSAVTGYQLPTLEQAQAGAIWAAMTSGDDARRNEALRTLFHAPNAVQEIVAQRSAASAALYYATPEGEAELADWRALDGEPFHDEEGDGDDL